MVLYFGSKTEYGIGNFDFLGKVLPNHDLSKQFISFLISDQYPLWAALKVD